MRSPSGRDSRPLRSNSRGGALYQCSHNDSLSRLVNGLFSRDFSGGVVSGRRAENAAQGDAQTGCGQRYLRRLQPPRGDRVLLPEQGEGEVWNPWTGERRPLYTVRPASEGTIVRLPLSQREVQLIVFGPGENDAIVETSTLSAIDSVTMVGGKVTLWGEGTTPGRVEAAVRYGGTIHSLAGESSHPAGRGNR